jgi:hypothetical protein
MSKAKKLWGEKGTVRYVIGLITPYHVGTTTGPLFSLNGQGKTWLQAFNHATRKHLASE